MKIFYDKKGLSIISAVFIISTIINAVMEDKYSILAIAFTIGVFSPYLAFVIIHLIYSLIRFREIRIFTDWRVSIFLLILHAMVMFGNYRRHNSKNNEEIPNPNRSEMIKTSFKSFLKKKNIDMNIDVPNKYETIQPYNKYSNYYFNIVSDFNNNWQHDRGVSEYAVFRTLNLDSAISIALIVVPINSEINNTENSNESFQNSPLKTMNSMYKGNYKKYLIQQLDSNSHVDIYDFEIKEKKVRSTNYLIHSYKYDEVTEDIKIPFIAVGYQTILWNLTYTFSLSCPLMFYNSSLIESIVERTNYLKPENIE